jgi:hypothetical protein
MTEPTLLEAVEAQFALQDLLRTDERAAKRQISDAFHAATGYYAPGWELIDYSHQTRLKRDAAFAAWLGERKAQNQAELRALVAAHRMLVERMQPLVDAIEEAYNYLNGPSCGSHCNCLLHRMESVLGKPDSRGTAPETY